MFHLKKHAFVTTEYRFYTFEKNEKQEVNKDELAQWKKKTKKKKLKGKQYAAGS